MTINDEIIVMWIEFFASVMGWSWIAALVSFIIGGILFLFSELLKENFFLSVCALNFMCISKVLSFPIHPVAVVQGKTLADSNDAQGAVQRKP